MAESADTRSDAPSASSIAIGAAPLESILCTEELHRRPSRPADYERENRALVKLVAALADSPRTILQTLADAILDITQCDSAGLSLLTVDGKTPNVCGNRFYWPAIAGMWKPHVGGGTPRNFGPCGDVLDQDRTLLFRRFERRYPYLLPVIPVAEECLLVPFYVDRAAVGTIWAIMHSDRRKFDAEDDRVMGSLGQFASSAYQALVSLDHLTFQVAEREKAEAAVRELANGLEMQVRARTRELEQSTQELLATNQELKKEIAERKRADEGLRRSEAFLAKAQRLSSTGSFSWRVTTDEIAWSEQTYRIFELDEGVHLTLELIASRVHPQDVWLWNEAVDRARADGSDFEFEHRLLLPDNSVKHLHIVAHGTRDQHGGLEYIGAVQDVTERRASDDALDQVRSVLAHVARVSSLGVLTASIAHELNQPLSGIINNASACVRLLAAAPPDVDRAADTARRTIRDANRASAVITRLRALFGNKGKVTEPVDLNEATREVIALSLSELQRNRVTVRQELARDLPPVTGDRVQLQQVILNLFLNACDAMRAVDGHRRELLVRTERDENDWVRLSVRDVGVGLDPEAMHKLFEPFYTTKSSGMGIGLCVSRSIIESHHGHLRASVNDGPGATFSFSIPCTLEDATATDHIAPDVTSQVAPAQASGNP